MSVFFVLPLSHGDPVVVPAKGNKYRIYATYFFYLAFSLSGEGHCYRFPQLQQALCRGGGDSPQHCH